MPSKHAIKVRPTRFCDSWHAILIHRVSVLRLDSKDADASQTKLFLLLQTEQYNAALDLIDSQEDGGKLAFEKVYTLYRLQRESEASQKLEEIKARLPPDRGVMHLEAQMVNIRLCFLLL